jgi:transposase
MRNQGTIAVVLGRRNHKRPIQYDERHYKDRWRVEAMFCRFKNIRRIATRCRKLSRSYFPAISLVTIIGF